MVAVTRPLADSLADAADPQHWLASLAPQYTDAEFAMLDKAFRLLNHGPTVLVSARHGGVSNVMAAAWVWLQRKPCQSALPAHG